MGPGGRGLETPGSADVRLACRGCGVGILPLWGLAPLCPVSPADGMSPHVAEDAPLHSGLPSWASASCTKRTSTRPTPGHGPAGLAVSGRADAPTSLHALIRQDASRIPEPPRRDRHTHTVPRLVDREHPREENHQPKGGRNRQQAAEKGGEPRGGPRREEVSRARKQRPHRQRSEPGQRRGGPRESPQPSPNSREDGAQDPSARRCSRCTSTW